MNDANATRSDRTIVGLSMEIDKHLTEIERLTEQADALRSEVRTRTQQWTLALDLMHDSDANVVDALVRGLGLVVLTHEHRRWSADSSERHSLHAWLSPFVCVEAHGPALSDAVEALDAQITARRDACEHPRRLTGRCVECGHVEIDGVTDAAEGRR